MELVVSALLTSISIDNLLYIVAGVALEISLVRSQA